MISYYFEDTDFIFKGKTLNNRWLKLVAESEIRRIGDISIIFCSDNYILDVNQKYLQHDYFTDIITFDYSNLDEGFISGDIYIDYQTVADNAKIYGTTAAREMLRVVVHGVLHLCGQGDKTPETEAVMHSKEDKYLELFTAKFAPKK